MKPDTTAHQQNEDDVVTLPTKYSLPFHAHNASVPPNLRYAEVEGEFSSFLLCLAFRSKPRPAVALPLALGRTRDGFVCQLRSVAISSDTTPHHHVVTLAYRNRVPRRLPRGRCRDEMGQEGYHRPRRPVDRFRPRQPSGTPHLPLSHPCQGDVH